jgi:hypothetical protein
MKLTFPKHDRIATPARARPIFLVFPEIASVTATVSESLPSLEIRWGRDRKTPGAIKHAKEAAPEIAAAEPSRKLSIKVPFQEAAYGLKRDEIIDCGFLLTLQHIAGKEKIQPFKKISCYSPRHCVKERYQTQGPPRDPPDHQGYYASKNRT